MRKVTSTTIMSCDRCQTELFRGTSDGISEAAPDVHDMARIRVSTEKVAVSLDLCRSCAEEVVNHLRPGGLDLYRDNLEA